MATSPKHDVTVSLVGEDGNAFNLIGIVARELRSQVSPEAASEFTTEAMEQPSYDALLSLIQNTVHVR